MPVYFPYKISFLSLFLFTCCCHDTIGRSITDTTSRSRLLASVYHQATARAMDQQFMELTATYPEAQAADLAYYDDAKTYIAMAFATANNNEEAEGYMGRLIESRGKCSRYFRLAGTYQRNTGNVQMAEKYARMSIDSGIAYLTKSGAAETGSVGSNIAASVTLFGQLLGRAQRYDEAVAYLSKAIPYCSEKNQSGLLNLQAELQTKAGHYEKAIEIYVRLLQMRMGGPAVEAKLKAAYIARPGANEQHYLTFYDSLQKKLEKEFNDSIRTSAFREKAPSFTLKDLHGKAVSLNDYLGKIVVLDFWATWCVPCKASFPAMQATIQKYEGNKDIVFLFIDTWETAANPSEAIEKYLSTNNYHFNVLLDAANPKTGKCEAVEKYKVDGVPAKFIIDKKGDIRFKLKGFNGSKEQSVNELSEMIDTINR